MGPTVGGDPQGRGTVFSLGPRRSPWQRAAHPAHALQLTLHCLSAAAFQSSSKGERFSPKSGVFTLWSPWAGRSQALGSRAGSLEVRFSCLPQNCLQVSAASPGCGAGAQPHPNLPAHSVKKKKKLAVCPNSRIKGTCKEQFIIKFAFPSVNA